MDITVLHVSQPTDGGVAVVAAQLAAHQARLGWSVALACPAFEDGPGAASLDGPADRAGPHPSWLSRAAASGGARVLPWEATRSPGRTAFAEAGRLRDLIREVKPDLVHLHSAKAGLAGRLALRGSLPTVFQPHAWSFEAVTGPTRTAALTWERWATRWTDVTVCVSAREQQDGERAGVHGAFTVVPNGVDPDVFTPGDRAEARAGLGLAGDRPLALVLGRLCPQKGQDILLDAWPAVLDRVPDAQLALVGDGPDRQTLADRIAADPRTAESVLLPGATGDALSWYRAADLLVVPSRWEGMALAPLEAMSCGCPVVAFEVAGIRESLPPQWAAGSLAAPGDGPALAALVIRRLAETGGADLASVPSGVPGTQEVSAAPGTPAARPGSARPDGPVTPGRPDPVRIKAESGPIRAHGRVRTHSAEARDWVLANHGIAQTADAISDCYSEHLRGRSSRLPQGSNL